MKLYHSCSNLYKRKLGSLVYTSTGDEQGRNWKYLAHLSTLLATGTVDHAKNSYNSTCVYAARFHASINFNSICTRGVVSPAVKGLAGETTRGAEHRQ